MCAIAVMIALALLWKAATTGLRLLVDGIATVLALVLHLRARRVGRTIVEGQTQVAIGPAAFDRKPTRTERRMMARGLRLAIRQTELRSLLPDTVARAERLAAALR